MKLPPFESVYGVDFSGAKLAGRNLWVARLVIDPTPNPLPRGGRGLSTPPSLGGKGAGGLGRRKPRLVELHRLESLCGTAERAACMDYLVRMVNASTAALWGFDAPFGLPLELFPPGAGWRDQFELLAEWGDDAYGCGLECIRRARLVGDRMHLRRTTDTEARAPFDSYHYRSDYRRAERPKFRGYNSLWTSHRSHRWHGRVHFPPVSLHGKLHPPDTYQPGILARPSRTLTR